MKWFKRKELKYEYVPAPEPRELTGIEKMEAQWRSEEAQARQRQISAILAKIQPDLDRYGLRCDIYFGPSHYGHTTVLSIAEYQMRQQQNAGMGNYGQYLDWNALLGGSGKC
jgi:hypothetical protein